MKQKNEIILQHFLILAGLLVGIKMIFCGLAPDEEYQITMSYRLAQGDGLFYKSWDTIQTSGFLNYFLINLYLLFGKTDGIVIFLRCCGLVFQLLTSLVLYRRLKKEINPINATLIAGFCFVAFTKMIVSPDFSNMLLWFQTLMLCFLWDAYERYQITGSLHGVKLFLAALMLCASILSQACFILVPIVVFMLCQLFPGHKWKANLIFFGTCAVSAIIYISGIFTASGYENVVCGIKGVLNGDVTYAKGVNIISRSKYITYLQNGLSILIYLVITALIAAAVSWIFRRFKKKWTFISVFAVCWNLVCCLFTLYVWFIQRAGYDGVKLYIPCFLCTTFAFWVKDKLQGLSESCPIPFWGILLGCGIFINVLWISNVPLINNISFLIPSVMWSMVLLSSQNWEQSLKSITLLFITFTAIAGTMFTMLSSPAGVMVFDCDGQIKKGPAKGIMTSGNVADVYNSESVSFSENISEDDTVLLVTNSYYNTLLCYLYLENNVNIAHYSVNSTPTFSKLLEEYWCIYRDKYPNVIVVNKSTSYNDLYGWIFDYIEHYYNYSRIEETEYAIYYFR